MELHQVAPQGVCVLGVRVWRVHGGSSVRRLGVHHCAAHHDALSHAPLTTARCCRSQAKVIVFVSTCKQVRFLFEAFRKLRPGVPLRALHGKMSQYKRMGGESLQHARLADKVLQLSRRSCSPCDSPISTCTHAASADHISPTPTLTHLRAGSWR